MIDPHYRSNAALIIGMLAIVLGLMETLSGEALLGYGQMVFRREAPKLFWKAVAAHFLSGIAAIGYSLYEKGGTQ